MIYGKRMEVMVDLSTWERFNEAIAGTEFGACPASVVIRRLIGRYIKEWEDRTGQTF